MDVSAASALTSSQSSSSTGFTASDMGESDFNTFLRMLTVQMQNQDPLNPIESTDYAVQLATFSGVEQQVRTNQLLDAMAAQFSLMGMSQLAGWVGQEARAAAPVWYSGEPVSLSPNPVASADRAVLVVKNAGGDVVSREDIPVSSEPYLWLGGDAAGDPLPEGKYTLSLESWRDDEMLQEDPVEYYGRVIEARGGAGGVRLVFEGGIEVAATAISALRVPPE